MSLEDAPQGDCSALPTTPQQIRALETGADTTTTSLFPLGADNNAERWKTHTKVAIPLLNQHIYAIKLWQDWATRKQATPEMQEGFVRLEKILIQLLRITESVVDIPSEKQKMLLSEARLELYSMQNDSCLQALIKPKIGVQREPNWDDVFHMYDEIWTEYLFGADRLDSAIGSAVSTSSESGTTAEPLSSESSSDGGVVAGDTIEEDYHFI